MTFDDVTLVIATDVALDLVIIYNMTAPRRSLKAFLYQQETSKVILQETKFILNENKSQSLPKQITSEL